MLFCEPFHSPSRRLGTFFPFSELGFERGEPECLCLGGSGLAHSVPETHLGENTSFICRCSCHPLAEMPWGCAWCGCSFLLKGLSVSLLRLWWQTGDGAQPRKAVPQRGYCHLLWLQVLQHSPAWGCGSCETGHSQLLQSTAGLVVPPARAGRREFLGYSLSYCSLVSWK